MSMVVITGSAGLVGSEASEYFCRKGYEVLGIDNDMRSVFFGPAASTHWNGRRLQEAFKGQYHPVNLDIRDGDSIMRLFSEHRSSIQAVIHTAAQPSHDWAARDPQTDFSVNANGTLNILEAARRQAPSAPFIFTSTNKVYGDTPNRLPLHEEAERWEIDPAHPYADGIQEDMSIDQTMHSVFGASKVAADILVQEYGRYFQLPTVCFRGGCLTGPNHSGTPLHGFLAYLMKCAATGQPYTIYGYKGKQVRDNIHSSDLIRAFACFIDSPRVGEVYNMGGGRSSHCSVLEAIRMCGEITGRPMKVSYEEVNRKGDHMWWISSNQKFSGHYPAWKIQFNLQQILVDIHSRNKERWEKPSFSE